MRDPGNKVDIKHEYLRVAGVEARCPLQQPTELVGDRVLRPYAPLGGKKVF